MVKAQSKIKKIIINADDFGLSRGTNLGIKEAHLKGVLTSTSLLATTPGFDEAVKIAKSCLKLGVGIHLSLTVGKPVSDTKQVFKLVDKGGKFYPSFIRLIYKSQTDKLFLSQVRVELNAQFDKLLKHGIYPDHINSERHVHMIPNIFPIVLQMAKKNKVKYLRIPSEDFRLIISFPELLNPLIDSNLIKFLLMKLFTFINRAKGKVKFFGIIYTTRMDTKIVKNILTHIGPGVSEILSHPARFLLTKKEKAILDYDDPKMINFMRSKNRQAELLALTNKSTLKLIKQNNIILTNYKKLKEYQ